MIIKKLVIAVGFALAFSTGTNVYSDEIISSKTGDSSLAPEAIPSGAVIYNPDLSEIIPKDSRSLSCAQFYGVSPAHITYSGGPRIEYRFENGYEKDSDGNYIKNANGEFVKSYTPWAFESGECFRNHTYSRDTTTCPTNQQGKIFEERKYTMTDADDMINDTGWVETSRTCDWYFLNSGSETRARACPSNQQGIYTDHRTFDNWSDGSKRNYSAWVLIGNTCAYFYQSTGTEYRNVACPSGQAGTHTQRRTYQNWSDGSKRSYSGWVTHSNSCAYFHVSNGHEFMDQGCPAGYNGHYRYIRYFQNWSDGSRRGHTGWSLYQNNCVLAQICTPGAKRWDPDRGGCEKVGQTCNGSGTAWQYDGRNNTNSCGYGN